MRRSLAKWLGVFGALIGLSIASGTGLADCPGSSVAQDVAVVETPQGSFRVEVCVAHDAAAKRNVYTLTVHNVSFACPFTSFAVRPFADVFVQLQPSPPWQPENEAPHWWIWDGPGAPIQQGRSRQFVLRVPDTLPINAVSGAVFPHSASACGAGERQFRLLVTASKDPAVICTCSPATPVLRSAEKIKVPAGYRAEYLVPPSVFNQPTDVIVRDDGSILVSSGRNHRIFLVSPSGAVSDWVTAPDSRTVDADAAGNIYDYRFVDGKIFLVSPSRTSVVAEFPPAHGACDLAVAPDGTLYVGHNAGGTGSIWEVSPGTGQRRALLSGLRENVRSLDIGSDGRLYAVIGDTLCEVDTRSGARTTIAARADWRLASPQGLAATQDGFYISTGHMGLEGKLYVVSRSGNVSLLATIPRNGLQGIALLPNGDIVGAQRCTGALLRVRPDGEIQTIIAGNGLVTPQSVTVLPCGELVVVNDEAGRASIVCPDGTVKPFIEMISFMPPLTHIAASAQGWLVAGESAPGFPSHLVRYSADGTRVVLAQDLPGVSGVALAPDGTIFASVTRDDKIVKLSPGGQRSTVVANVRQPLALALSPDGVLYAILNQDGVRDEEGPDYGDTVIQISPDGRIRVLAKIPFANGLALGNDGAIYVAAGTVVKEIDKWGFQSVFASGFQRAQGIALQAGAFYVTDEVANCIVKISRAGQ